MWYFNPGDCNTAILYISYSHSDCLIEASRTEYQESVKRNTSTRMTGSWNSFSGMFPNGRPRRQSLQRKV